MRHARVILLVLLMLEPLRGVSLAQQPSLGAQPNPTEDQKHGAVFCAWLIYREAREIGDRCTKQRDASFLAALDRAIVRIDAYIVKNAPISDEKLQVLKQGRSNMDPLETLCRPDGVRLYEMLESRGADGLERGVADLLAVPRRPAMAPCL